MLKIRYLFIAIICLLGSIDAFAEINLSTTVRCTYQIGQTLDKKQAENVKNSVPLNRTFNGLLSKQPILGAGGDTGEVIAVPMDKGVIVYLPSSYGTSTYTVWESGDSFWSNQSNISGDIYSQHYLGTCEN